MIKLFKLILNLKEKNKCLLVPNLKNKIKKLIIQKVLKLLDYLMEELGK